jgi:hypothetical protein
MGSDRAEHTQQHTKITHIITSKYYIEYLLNDICMNKICKLNLQEEEKDSIISIIARCHFLYKNDKHINI